MPSVNSFAQLGTLMGLEKTELDFKFLACQFLRDGGGQQEFRSAEGLLDFLWDERDKGWEERMDIIHIIILDSKGRICFDGNYHTSMRESASDDFLMMFDDPDRYKNVLYIRGSKTKTVREEVPDTKYKKSWGATKTVRKQVTTEFKIPILEIVHYESTFNRILRAVSTPDQRFSSLDYDDIHVCNWDDEVVYTYEDLLQEKLHQDVIKKNLEKIDFKLLNSDAGVSAYVKKCFADLNQWAMENWQGDGSHGDVIHGFTFLCNGILYIHYNTNTHNDKLREILNGKLQNRLERNLTRNFPKYEGYQVGHFGNFSFTGYRTPELKENIICKVDSSSGSRGYFSLIDKVLEDS